MCSCAQTTRKMATLTGWGSLCIKVRLWGFGVQDLHCIASGEQCRTIHHFSRASAQHSMLQLTCRLPVGCCSPGVVSASLQANVFGVCSPAPASFGMQLITCYSPLGSLHRPALRQCIGRAGCF